MGSLPDDASSRFSLPARFFGAFFLYHNSFNHFLGLNKVKRISGPIHALV
jgi:hypothetical protein